MASASVKGTTSPCALVRFNVPSSEIRIIEGFETRHSEQWIFELRLCVSPTAEYPDLPSGDWACRINSIVDMFDASSFRLGGFTELIPPYNIAESKTGHLAYFTVTGENIEYKGSVGWCVDNRGKGSWRSELDGMKSKYISSSRFSDNAFADIQKNRTAWTYILGPKRTIEVELIIPLSSTEKVTKQRSSLSTRLFDGYTAKRHTDCVLISRDGKEFPAHRFILATGSSVFEAMFEHDMQEKRSGVCKIDDIDCNILQILLEFLYTERTDPEQLKDVGEDVYNAADKYVVADLCAACEDIMVKDMADKLSAKTALSYLNFAVARGLDGLKWRAIKFLNDNAGGI